MALARCSFSEAAQWLSLNQYQPRHIHTSPIFALKIISRYINHISVSPSYLDYGYTRSPASEWPGNISPLMTSAFPPPITWLIRPNTAMMSWRLGPSGTRPCAVSSRGFTLPRLWQELFWFRFSELRGTLVLGEGKGKRHLRVDLGVSDLERARVLSEEVCVGAGCLKVITWFRMTCSLPFKGPVERWGRFSVGDNPKRLLSWIEKRAGRYPSRLRCCLATWETGKRKIWYRVWELIFTLSCYLADLTLLALEGALLQFIWRSSCEVEVSRLLINRLRYGGDGFVFPRCWHAMSLIRAT